jgi:AcrR family transcriptional regulator
MVGRPRSEVAREAILKAALDIVRERGFGQLTADGLAAAAGVGKQTIYRWWSSLAEVVLEATRMVARQIDVPETGSLEGDLAALLAASFRYNRGANSLRVVLGGLMAEAQLAPEFAPKFAAFIEERRSVLRGVMLRHVPADRRDDVEAAVDMMFGAMWYRVLVGHAPLDAEFARTLARLAAAPHCDPRR